MAPPRRPAGNAVVKVDDARILDLRRDQKSFAEIAAIVGCSSRTVERSLERSRRAGLDVPPKKEPERPWTEEEDCRALAMLQDGVPYTEVARTLGRSIKGKHLERKFPGYGGTPSDSLAIARMFRDFERLLERHGLSDTSGRNR